MSLDVGSKLGPYEIVSSLGSEVYKATNGEDSRPVAIRVFPPDSLLKERFEKQAQAVAALSHPHIGLLYDMGQQDGVDFLVTEFVEGETLAARLGRGALPLGEAMQVALAIGDALDKAHCAGVVHRELKPSCVMLTASGAKLIDFGLSELRPSSAAALIPKSSTATVAAVGAKPGAASGIGYMAPEHFEGKPIDARSDIFSFGAIVHEMVTGKKAFEGKSRAVLIAAVTEEDPDPLTQLEPRAPLALEHVVQRCLAKDPMDRWQTAHDLMVRLRWSNGGPAPVAEAGMAEQAQPRRMPRIWMAAAALGLAALAVPAALYFRGPEPPSRFQFRVPVVGQGTSSFALSPDGQTMALVLRPDAQEPPMLYVRPTGGLAFNKLPGTEDAAQPFWSPDNRFIGFAAKGRIKKVSVAGGAPQDVAEAAGFSGGTWNAEGTILFGSDKGLQRVSAEGGKPVAATTLEGKDSGHFWPCFLPGGKQFLYLAWSSEAAARAVFVGSLDSKEKTRLTISASNAVYAPGYVLFHREDSLFAHTFDARNRTLRGQPIHVADEVSANPANGRGSFDVSQNGVLLYFQGAGAPAGRAGISPIARWGWFDRSGLEVADAGETGPYGDMDVSPDGKLIATTRQETGSAGADIWVIDWQRAGVTTRLTLDAADDINPVWSPDSTQVAFTTFRKGNADIYVKNANGSGGETALLESPVDEMVEDWSKDGQFIVYLSGQNAAPDIYALPLSGDKKPFPVVQGNFRKDEPQFSFDGKWLAYTSDESGTFQVYVMSFPKGDQKVQVSTDGGGQPRWRKDGKELYYKALDNRIMALDVKPGAKLESGVPHLLFRAGGNPTNGAVPTRHLMSVTPDGQRFLLRANPARGLATGRSSLPSAPITASGQAGGANPFNTRGGNLATISIGLTVVQHWTAGLEKGQK